MLLVVLAEGPQVFPLLTFSLISIIDGESLKPRFAYENFQHPNNYPFLSVQCALFYPY